MIEAHWLLFAIASVVLIATPCSPRLAWAPCCARCGASHTHDSGAGLAVRGADLCGQGAGGGLRGAALVLVPRASHGTGLVVPWQWHGVVGSGTAPGIGAQGVIR